ncbi:MAG: lipocalin-like domain-containing protein [Bacteroidales bacterium]
MKTIIKYGWIAPLLLWTACSKSTNSLLEGKWQLQQIEADGGVQQIDTVFYNFQTSLFMYQIYHRSAENYSVCYGYKTLTEEGELLLELLDASFLPSTDWVKSPQTFTIEKVTGSRLVLSGEDRKRYSFRKF